MIIVGENLKNLIVQHEMVNKKNCFDETCITLSLSKHIYRFKENEKHTLVYGEKIPSKYYKKEQIKENGILIPSKGTVLACSNEYLKMPQGYFGLVQTKGTLARMFVFANCADGQIDPGFEGRITFEIFNASPFEIRFRRLDKIANLYIIKASCKNTQKYQGKYLRAKEPTLPKRME